MPLPEPMPGLTRRSALLGLGGAFTLGRASLAFAAPAATLHDRRLVVVILRGALDGLSAVAPYGDPDLAALRAPLLPGLPGTEGGLLDLGGFYGLHPALAGLHGLYAASQLLVVHAVAGDWRSRSHFDAQDYLESGADRRMTSGWLNRAALALPGAARAGVAAPLAVGPNVPLLLRGTAAVDNWQPRGFRQPDPDLYGRLVAMHRPDPVTGPAIAAGLHDRGFTDAVLAGAEAPHNRGSFPALAAAAGRLLAAADGPRIAALEIGGWDTHAGQASRLAAGGGPLRQLDQGLVALRETLGAAWLRTAVLVMTEFGRTVRVNGTNGTDHGTATVAFVLGGAVAGGRVRANWPGLAPDRLFEARDLQPTTDLRSVAKGLLAGHLGLSDTALAGVFPNSGAAMPSTGMLRA